MIKKQDVYYKKTKKKEKIVLSEKFSIKLIKKIHTELCHIGINQKLKTISSNYTAKNLTKNIKEICKNCETCIKNKSRGQEKFGFMSHLGPATKPFEIISIDTIGGFGGSRSTKKYLHLLVDHLTRYAIIATSKTQNAHDFIKLVNKVSDSEDIKLLLADQYAGINSTEFKYYLDNKHITMVFTAVNSPFSNGLNERLNQTLVNKIRCKMNEKKEKNIAWTTIAQECVNIYNETIHSITGFTPKYLMYGIDTTIVPSEL